jgi:hypothetical protein
MSAAIRTPGVARLTIGLVVIAAAVFCSEALAESALPTDEMV